jgi:hypothetical protein
MNEKMYIVRVASAVLGAVGLFLLARRKNRNTWFWGAMGVVAGALAPLLLVIPLIRLSFAKYRCAKCGNDLTNQQARSKECPACAASPAANVVS